MMAVNIVICIIESWSLGKYAEMKVRSAKAAPCRLLADPKGSAQKGDGERDVL